MPEHGEDATHDIPMESNLKHSEDTPTDESDKLHHEADSEEQSPSHAPEDPEVHSDHHSDHPSEGHAQEHVQKQDTEQAQLQALTEQKPRNMKGYVWILIVVAVFSATFLYALDNTIVADVQPTLIRDLGDIQKLPWVSVGYRLGATSMNLLWGKLYGSFEAKTLFLIAVALFEIGSAICGAAPTMNALIVGRTICGVGGSGVYLGAINIVSVFTTLQERPGHLSFLAVSWGFGTVLGPIIGGALTDSSAGWRWSFYLNLVICAVAAPVYLFLLPPHQPRPGTPFSKRIRELDFAGAILFLGTLVSILMAISFGGALYSWSSGQIIGLFCCAGVLCILFVLQQGFCILTSRERRLFPAHLLQNYEMWILWVETCASAAALFVPIYFIPLFFQFVRNDSALEAAVRLLPLILVSVTVSVLNGVVMGKTGYYMPWYVAGSALVVVACALLRMVSKTTSAAAMYGFTVILAVGVGSFTQTSFPVAQSKVAPSQIPQAVAFIGCAQLIGLALSFSIANCLFINMATLRIEAILPGTSLRQVQKAISGVGSELFERLPQGQKNQILDAVTRSIGNVYDMLLAGAALALILSLFMRREKAFTQR